MQNACTMYARSIQDPCRIHVDPCGINAESMQIPYRIHVESTDLPSRIFANSIQNARSDDAEIM